MTTRSVTRLELGERELFIVGTAHVSRQSVEEVEQAISDLRPDTVCVELDSTRYEALANDGGWRRMDLGRAIAECNAPFLLVTLALSAYQKKLGARLGVRPGAELLAAVRTAERIGAKVVLADRDIDATLRRIWRNVSLGNKLRLGFMLLATPAALEQITEEQVEELKRRETVGGMLDQLAQQMPRLKGTLIDERDRYLMSSIADAPGRRLVAVVGAGHVQGMTARVGEQADRAELSRVPPPTLIACALAWLRPLSALALASVLFVVHGRAGLITAVWIWTTSTIAAAAVSALVAGARATSFAVATLLAPLLALGPACLAGSSAGRLEARQNPPDDLDRTRVLDDMLSLSGMRKNRFTRPLLVAVLVGASVALGGWVGVFRLLLALRYQEIPSSPGEEDGRPIRVRCRSMDQHKKGGRAEDSGMGPTK